MCLPDLTPASLHMPLRCTGAHYSPIRTDGGYLTAIVLRGTTDTGTPPNRLLHRRYIRSVLSVSNSGERMVQNGPESFRHEKNCWLVTKYAALTIVHTNQPPSSTSILYTHQLARKYRPIITNKDHPSIPEPFLLNPTSGVYLAVQRISSRRPDETKVLLHLQLQREIRRKHLFLENPVPT
jgi:hypothetical protein